MWAVARTKVFTEGQCRGFGRIGKSRDSYVLLEETARPGVQLGGTNLGSYLKQGPVLALTTNRLHDSPRLVIECSFIKFFGRIERSIRLYKWRDVHHPDPEPPYCNPAAARSHPGQLLPEN